MVVSVKLMRPRFFFAASMPLRIACGTSFALPEPYPTTPAPGSPTTTSAANDMFLPPLTTLVTRLIATTWSFRLYCPASSFLFSVAIRFLISFWPAYAAPKNLKLETGFARCIGEGLHASVIEIPATIEHNLLDALFLRALRNQLAHLLRCRHIATCLQLRGLGRCGNNCDALCIVNHLGINVVQRAIHVQARPLRRADNLGANAVMDALANFVSVSLRNHFLSSFLVAEPPCGPVRFINLASIEILRRATRSSG